MFRSGYSPNTASSKTSTSPSRAELRKLPFAELLRTRLGLSYCLAQARADLQAGITVAAISLPQSIAYALIAGVDPRFGLYTAIVFTFIASIFGSSSHLINGPTGAVSMVVFSTLSFFDPDARLDAYEGHVSVRCHDRDHSDLDRRAQAG